MQTQLNYSSPTYRKPRFLAVSRACSPLFIAFSIVATASVALGQNGAPITWSGSPSSSWTSTNNWVGGALPANSIGYGAGNIARFSLANPGSQPTLSSNRSIYGVQFWADNYILGGGDNVLSVGGGGINVAADMNARVNTALGGSTQSYLIAANALFTTTRAVNNSAILTKSGDGTWEIANGIVTASQGLNISAGTVRFGGNNRISSDTAITLGNATLDLNGYSSTNSALLLNGSGVIDFGTQLTTNILSFDNSSAIDWSLGTLTILNYKPGSTRLRFGTDSSGLTETQLSLISFDGFAGEVTIDSLGYIAPIPESGTVSLLIGAAAACSIFALRKRRSRC